MKRIIICLLLICIICLGCFALTACDKESNEYSDVPEPENIIETTETSPGIFNFKLWYSKDFYDHNLFIPVIKCTSQLIGTANNTTITDGSPPYLDAIPKTIIVYPYTTNADQTYNARFLSNKDSLNYAIAPNTWITFDLELTVTHVVVGGYSELPEEYKYWFPSPIFEIELYSFDDCDLQNPIFTKIIDFDKEPIKSAF